MDLFAALLGNVPKQRSRSLRKRKVGLNQRMRLAFLCSLVPFLASACLVGHANPAILWIRNDAGAAVEVGVAAVNGGNRASGPSVEPGTTYEVGPTSDEECPYATVILGEWSSVRITVHGGPVSHVAEQDINLAEASPPGQVYVHVDQDGGVAFNVGFPPGPICGGSARMAG